MVGRAARMAENIHPPGGMLMQTSSTTPLMPAPISHQSANHSINVQRGTAFPIASMSAPSETITRRSGPMSADITLTPLRRRGRNTQAQEDATPATPRTRFDAEISERARMLATSQTPMFTQMSTMDSPTPPPRCVPLTPPSTSKKRKRSNPKSKSPSDESGLSSLSTEVRSLTRRLRATERELDDTKQKLADGTATMKRKNASRAPLATGPK